MYFAPIPSVLRPLGLAEMALARKCHVPRMEDAIDMIEELPYGGNSEGGAPDGRGELWTSGLDGPCDPLVGRRVRPV